MCTAQAGRETKQTHRERELCARRALGEKLSRRREREREREREVCARAGRARPRAAVPVTRFRRFFFFVINNFLFLFFHKQHNIISKIKQNKTADTYSTSQGSVKREGEREGQQEHKSYSFK